MLTPLRRLHSVTYWVIEDPILISDFINTNIRREWEADARSEDRNPDADSWLQNLSARKWSLETVQTSNIRLNPKVMEFVDDRRGYSFASSLAKRSDSLRREIETYDTVIWPLIVRAEDMQLMDGYCRYSTLKRMEVPQTYGYVGRQ
jgi:hypothetical protein